MFKSYNILFDTWIKNEGPKLSDDYSDIMKNLFIINKSYMHYSNDLSIDYDYISNKNNILETPMYLYDLINQTESVNDVKEFDPDNLTEILYTVDGKDYLLDESTNEVYTTEGVKIGLWENDKGIILQD